MNRPTVPVTNIRLNISALNFLLALIVLTIAANLAHADIIKYRDESGATHYVDSISKVPEAYRRQLEGATPLPRINKVPSFTGEKKVSQNLGTSPKVEIYVTSWCPHCKNLEAFLREKSIPFNRFDIERDKNARSVYQRLGGGGVPLVKIGNSTRGGFDPGWILAQVKG